MAEIFNSPVFWTGLLTALFNLWISVRTIRKNLSVQEAIERTKGDIAKDTETYKHNLAIQKDVFTRDYDSVLRKRDDAAGNLLNSVFEICQEAETLVYESNLLSRYFENAGNKLTTGDRHQSLQIMNQLSNNRTQIEGKIVNLRVKINQILRLEAMKNTLWFDDSYRIMAVIHRIEEGLLSQVDCAESAFNFYFEKADAMTKPGSISAESIIRSALEASSALKHRCNEKSIEVHSGVKLLRGIVQKEYKKS